MFRRLLCLLTFTIFQPLTTVAIDFRPYRFVSFLLVLNIVLAMFNDDVPA